MRAYNSVTNRGILFLGSSLFMGLLACLVFVLEVMFASPAFAQNTCTTRVTENVIHSHRGSKVQIVEHRTCGYNTTTKYYYRDYANGYTNEYERHGNHSHRTYRSNQHSGSRRHYDYGRPYRGHHRPRYYRQHSGYDFEIRDRNFHIRLHGGH